LKAGYPTRNIIFEDTRVAVLYQDRGEAGEFALTEPVKVAELLNRFLAHDEGDGREFERAMTVRHGERIYMNNTVAGSLLMGIQLLVPWNVLGQSTPPVPRFDVASVKVNHSSGPQSGGFSHGRLTIHGETLKHLVGAAYDTRVDLVTGGPSWVDTDRFDIDAKADPDSSEHLSRVMLQALLTERFALTVHREERMRRVFVLTVMDGGPKLKKASEDASSRRCVGTHPLTCTKRTMAEFADVLRRIPSGIDVPVVDETGLDGRYDFQLTFAEANFRSADGPGTEVPVPSKQRNEDVPIFEAVQAQLGLKLKDAKRPVEFLVIDRVNRVPIEN